MSLIKYVHARQILDSRGNPTIEVDVTTSTGAFGRASVPSGASTGIYEAVELRDGDKSKFMGKGVSKAVHIVNKKIAKRLISMSIFDQSRIDRTMIEMDGTTDKSILGANAILGCSLAVAKAAADEARKPLFIHMGGSAANTLPMPMMNILNGGVHADNEIDFQEFMIVPVKADTFSEALRIGVEIFFHLKKVLLDAGLSANVGDEGGFAPQINSNKKALETVLLAIERAGYRPGEDVCIALDAAATELYDPKTNLYHITEGGHKTLSSEEMVAYWDKWVAKYPIISIEDGLAEDDWSGWKHLTDTLGNKIQLVGDDLFVTNVIRLRKGIDRGVANAVLVKVNQIGSLTETLDVITLAKSYAYNNIISHRSGETEDNIIADLAVACNTGQIKTGSLCRSDRTAKYNQLLRIEEYLGSKARFANMGIVQNI